MYSVVEEFNHLKNKDRDRSECLVASVSNRDRWETWARGANLGLEAKK